mmetsp:Transcript_23605/g.53132  ORF Transcript_23605/g.53132 Transcript_23605/m.53132 type:complete len:240 (+) Transcript_23605:78-797(+)
MLPSHGPRSLLLGRRRGVLAAVGAWLWVGALRSASAEPLPPCFRLLAHLGCPPPLATGGAVVRASPARGTPPLSELDRAAAEANSARVRRTIGGLVAGLLVFAAGISTVQAAAPPTAAEPGVGAGAPPTRQGGLFSILLNLRQEENNIKQDEQKLAEEINKDRQSFNLLDAARLLNMEAILKNEETVLRDEEKDVKSKDSRSLSKDAARLAELERIESKLIFESKENKELDALQRLLPK